MWAVYLCLMFSVIPWPKVGIAAPQALHPPSLSSSFLGEPSATTRQVKPRTRTFIGLYGVSLPCSKVLYRCYGVRMVLPSPLPISLSAQVCVALACSIAQSGARAELLLLIVIGSTSTITSQNTRILFSILQSCRRSACGQSQIRQSAASLGVLGPYKLYEAHQVGHEPGLGVAGLGSLRP
jgi:hypothetical protein